jgi:hypothetical protein
MWSTTSIYAPCRKLEVILFFLLGIFITEFLIISIHFHMSGYTTSETASFSSFLSPHSNVDAENEYEYEYTLDQLPVITAQVDNLKVRKRRRKKRKKVQKWDPGLDGLGLGPLPLNISTPVFVPSLPKSGTTSIWQYFNCGGHKASHQVSLLSSLLLNRALKCRFNSGVIWLLQWIRLNETYSIQTGECVQKNIAVDRPPFEGCGDYDVYTDTGYATARIPPSVTCFYPSVDALDQIYRHYPNITFIMVVRNTAQWYKSLESWGEGSLLNRWKLCNTTNLPGVDATEQDFMQFYDWHTDRIRKFVSDKPSIRYIEVQLESKDTGAILEREVGIPSRCWAKCTPYSKFCEG